MHQLVNRLIFDNNWLVSQLACQIYLILNLLNITFLRGNELHPFLSRLNPPKENAAIYIHIYIYIYIYKGKAFPLQARRGDDDSRKLRFPNFMTMAQDGAKVVSLTHRPTLTPENAPGTHFC